MDAPKRYKLIACEIMFREICHCAAKCRNIIDIVLMPKGLHDIGQSKMYERLQAEIDKVDAEKYGAVLLCYGLCNNGIAGLRSKLPIIVPRAHDCITLLLGSKEKYDEYFRSNPGTYFKSPGWTERDNDPDEAGQSVISQLGMNRTCQEYLTKYGEENARYIMETLGDWRKNYKKIAYIDTKTGNFDSYKESARQQAADNGWEYEEVAGDTGLIMRLLDGEWDPEDFLIIPPGSRIESSGTERIIQCKPIIANS